jgi:hypothetical protein
MIKTTSHQPTEYSYEVNGVARQIERLCERSGLARADTTSAIAECLLDAFVALRGEFGDVVVPEMRRFAERVNAMAEAPDAAAMHAICEHLADADVPTTEKH